MKTIRGTFVGASTLGLDRDGARRAFPAVPALGFRSRDPAPGRHFVAVQEDFRFEHRIQPCEKCVLVVMAMPPRGGPYCCR